MIMELKVTICDFDPECSRIIEIDSQASLIDLHEIIQNSVQFDNDHLFEFFLGRHSRNRSIMIGQEDEWDDFDPYDTYGEIPLSQIWPLPAKGLKLFYLFDFGDEWRFRITKSRRKEKEPQVGTIYPRVIKEIGENPEQYPDWDE